MNGQEAYTKNQFVNIKEKGVNIMNQRPFVISISGISGAGKTDLVQRLTEYFGQEAVYVALDEYYATTKYPENDMAWVRNGADPNEIEDPKYLEDLFTLLSDGSIINPHTKNVIETTKFIILDEPFGRSRLRMNEIIDLAVHIEIPLEIALARRLQRQLLKDSNPEAFVKFMNEYIPNYLYNGYREFYIEVNRIAKQDCNLILNGINTLEDHVGKILDKLMVLKVIFK